MNHLCKHLGLCSDAAQGCVLSPECPPQLMQGCIVEGAGAGTGGWGILAAGTEVAALPPEIWAASLAVFSQDLSVPDLALSCGVEWAESECSH